MRKHLALTLVLAILCSGCKPEKVVTEGRLKDVWAQVSDRDYIRTRGMGVPDPQIVGKTHRRAAARNAALVSARYEMLAIIKGIRVTGGLSVASLIEKDSRIREIADRIIEGAEEIQTEFTADDGCIVVLELSRKKARQIIIKDEASRGPKLDHSMRRFWHRNRTVEDDLRVAVSKNRAIPGRRKKVILSGLLFPGAGQILASQYINDNGISRRIKSNGLITMAGTLGLAGVGVGLLFEEPETKSDRGTGKERKTNPKGGAYVLIGLAGLLHIYGVFDANRAMERNKYGIDIYYGRKLTQFKVSKRF